MLKTKKQQQKTIKRGQTPQLGGGEKPPEFSLPRTQTEQRIARLTVPLFPTETKALDRINENILRLTPEQAETTPFESKEIKGVVLVETRHPFRWKSRGCGS